MKRTFVAVVAEAIASMVFFPCNFWFQFLSLAGYCKLWLEAARDCPAVQQPQNTGVLGPGVSYPPICFAGGRTDAHQAQVVPVLYRDRKQQGGTWPRNGTKISMGLLRRCDEAFPL